MNNEDDDADVYLTRDTESGCTLPIRLPRIYMPLRTISLDSIGVYGVTIDAKRGFLPCRWFNCTMGKREKRMIMKKKKNTNTNEGYEGSLARELLQSERRAAQEQ